MGIAAISFVTVFLLVVTGGLLLFYRQAMIQRISDVVSPPAKRADLLGAIQQTASSLGGFVQSLDHVLPKSDLEVSIVEKRLIRAGYRKASAVKFFYGAKLLAPLALCLLAVVTGLVSSSPFFAWATALGVGFLLPDFWLGRRISKRQQQIRLGLPDALDFLVICIEAGLSMDQATMRTAGELRFGRPALSDELDIVVLEQRAGRLRSDAWKQFAERTDVDSVRVLVSVLVQSEQLGTSIARTLRVHSDSLRVQRRQKVEELAAKTSIKLVFPLVFFIFPSLFVVTLGPEVIIMMQSFKTYFSN
jgi:tight adherence protein C